MNDNFNEACYKNKKNHLFRVECTCSDSLEDLHRIDRKLCNVKCQGNHKQSCGGSQEGVFSIYSKKFGK